MSRGHFAPSHIFVRFHQFSNIFKTFSVWPTYINQIPIQRYRRIYNNPLAFSSPPGIKFIGLPGQGIFYDLISDAKRHYLFALFLIIARASVALSFIASSRNLAWPMG